MIIAVVEDRTLSILAETFAATIAAKDIEHSFHALTHFPERRTLSELEGLAERLNVHGGAVGASKTAPAGC